MAAKRDYYEVLGVDKSADAATIKRGYRQMAKKYHPDNNPGDTQAEAMFKEVNEAYEILSDPQKKAQYDQYGHAAFDQTQGGGANGYGTYGGFSGDMSDIFGEMFGDIFGSSRSTGRRNGPMKGENVRTSVRISFEEAIFGCKKEVTLNLKDSCTKCNGTGAKPGTSPQTCTSCNGSGQKIYTQQTMLGMMRNVTICPDCNGTGKMIKDKCTDCRGTGFVTSRKTIEVNIPAGIDNGQSIRIREKGEPGMNGGERGDLLVEIIVSQHPIFKRQETNIYSTMPISFTQAALGATLKIATVDGIEEYKINPGTQTDTKIRLRGKGVPSLHSRSSRGDHIVTLVVQVPTTLTAEQREALKRFEETMTGEGSTSSSNSNQEKESGRKKKFFK